MASDPHNRSQRPIDDDEDPVSFRFRLWFPISLIPNKINQCETGCCNPGNYLYSNFDRLSFL